MIIKFQDKDINVKESLTLVESIAFVQSVVDDTVSLEDKSYTPLLYDLGLVKYFITYYTDLESPDLETLYSNYKDYKDFVDIIIVSDGFNEDQYYKLVNAIDDEIYLKKEQLIHSSAMDDMFASLNTLLTTLNSKAQELDVKKLEKILKKLNPQEIFKAYQKFGIGNDVRDNAIQELGKKLRQYENNEKAKNVLADKKA
jgi:hypothetical protein